MVDGFAVHPHRRDGVGVKGLLDFLADALGQSDQTADFHAAAGAAGTGADEHQGHQDGLGKGRPQVVVTAGKAGGGDDGAHLEGRLLHRGAEIGKEIPDVPADHGDGRRNDDQVPADFLDGDGLLEFAAGQVEVGAEVDTEQNHKDRHHHLDVGGIAGQAVIADTEAAGAGGAESNQQSIHQGTAPRQHKENLEDGHPQIDGVEDFGGGLDRGNHFFDLGAGAFGLHQVDMAAAGQRHHGQQKDQNAHAADPVGEAAPEQNPHGQALHVGQDRSAGGGETRHRLKQGGDGVGNGPRQDKGHRSHDTDDHPGQRRGDAALPHVENFAARLEKGEGKPDDKAEGHREQENPQDIPFVVEGADQGGQAHQPAFTQQNIPQQTEYNRIVHRRALPCPATMSRRS